MKRQLLKLLLTIPSILWGIVTLVSGNRIENDLAPVVEGFFIERGISMTALNIIAAAIFVAPILWYVWGIRKTRLK